ncbi:MAG: hypothetical protein JWO46_3225, partial [Nocardioidaceae bacterium]|nr:hypothetical protein [Nocardioidaceae bacterium]
QARPATTAATTAAPVVKRAAPAAPAPAEPAVADEALCGHKAISGRTCTREQGHAAKSHRYS